MVGMWISLHGTQRYPGLKQIQIKYKVECPCGNGQDQNLIIKRCSNLNVECSDCNKKATFPIEMLLHEHIQDLPNYNPGYRQDWDDSYYYALEGYTKFYD